MKQAEEDRELREWRSACVFGSRSLLKRIMEMVRKTTVRTGSLEGTCRALGLY